MLPDGDGIELLAALGEAQRPPCTIVITACSSFDNEQRVQHLNVSCLLRKPLDLQQLLSVVRSAEETGA